MRQFIGMSKMSKTNRLLFLGTACVLFVYYFSLLYPDITVTHHHSLTLIDCILSGDLRGFYARSFEDQFGGWGAVYYLPIYFIFAVWNIPIWIGVKLNLIPEQGMAALLWIKTLVVIFALLCVYFVNKLLYETKCKDPVFFTLLFFSSLIFVVPSFAIVQYDAICVAFSLWGVYKCVKEKKISWKTLAIFSLAISLKLFSLFTFTILVLLMEKRILHIIKDMIVGTLVTVVSVFPYIRDEGYQMCVSSFNDGILERLLNCGIEGGYGTISLFCVGAIATFVVAYYLKPENASSMIKSLAWLNTLFYVSFFTFMQYAHPYWIILLSPYVILLIAENEGKLKLNLILESALELSIIAVQAMLFYWVMLSSSSFGNLLLKKIPAVSDRHQISSFRDMADMLDVVKFMPALTAAFIACSGAILIINNPWRDHSKEIPEAGISTIKHGFGIFRILCLLVYLLLSIMIVYFI